MHTHTCIHRKTYTHTYMHTCIHIHACTHQALTHMAHALPLWTTDTRSHRAPHQAAHHAARRPPEAVDWKSFFGPTRLTVPPPPLLHPISSLRICTRLPAARLPTPLALQGRISSCKILCSNPVLYNYSHGNCQRDLGVDKLPVVLLANSKHGVVAESRI